MTLNIQILRSLTVVSIQNISCANFDETFLFIIAWVKRVIDSKELTSIVTTSLEIRKLVQAFLHARSLVVLPRRCIVPSCMLCPEGGQCLESKMARRDEWYT